MNSQTVKSLRSKLAAKQPTYGLWVTLESATVTEMSVAIGLDWVVIDAEHGHLDWHHILEHVRAAVRSHTVVLVRIAELNGGLIKRSLDIGADGVVIPWIETAEQLRQAVALAHYPPSGTRGIGGERATCWGSCLADSVKEADENVLVVPIIESVRGGRNASALAHVNGVELYFLGPADYSSTAGYPGQWEGGDVASQLLAIKDAIVRSGKHCGVMATDAADLVVRRDQGFSLLGLGLDAPLLLRSIRQMLAPVGRDARPNTRFTLETDWSSVERKSPAPLTAVPPSMRAERRESMNVRGSGKLMEIARGVQFECLVGAHNHARNLTTGIATFDPGATLPYHVHTFAESITLLSGSAALEVEGRRYVLGEMDNAVLPRELAHKVVNTSASVPAVFHVAMASSEPARTLVDRFFSRRTMPDLAPPVEGHERVNWFRSAPRLQAGPGATFIDYFNRELMPGIEMSGGHGTFAPGGRLPCHIHDFDESICIVEGIATCVVEGRRYQMRDCATALQPRGRCHYFVNEFDVPMVMLWVYAGPMPERIVIEEQICLVAGTNAGDAD